MIEKVEMFTIVCDNCGEDAGSGSEYSCWNDPDIAKEMAMDMVALFLRRHELLDN